MHTLTDIGLFALLFFLLVFIHELGHYLMAKWVGIRVERFSIGMGPSLFAFKWGDTEYKLGLLPLGGYVKMFGDDITKQYSEEEKKIGFLTQKPPAKLLVVFGGPVFNLLLPIFLLGGLLAFGIPQMKSVIGTVEPDKPAAKAGLQSGDLVVAVNGKYIRKWAELEERVQNSAGQNLTLGIERQDLKSGDTKYLELPVVPDLAQGKSRFGEDIQVGRIGVSPDFQIAQIFFENAQAPFAKAGFQNFDRVVAINQIKILGEPQFHQVLENLEPGLAKFEVTRLVDGKEKSFSAEVKVPKGNRRFEALGLFSPDLVISHIEPGQPAEKAGLKEGDRIVSVGGVKIKVWDEFSKQVRGSKGKALQLEWSRQGKPMKATLTPEQTVIADPLMGKDNPLAREPVYRIGVSPATRADTSLMIERSLNPVDWIRRGLRETWTMTSMTVEALTKLVTGHLSLKLLGSPIMIYKVAGNSYRMAGGGHYGWVSFFSNLALLSITLGLVNLLPIPVLDGGHATFFIIEWIRGRPLSLKIMELAQQVGLFILMSLFAFVLYNDFYRYGFIDRVLNLFR